MDDLVLGECLRRPTRGKKVRLIQEWLCLNGFNVRIDGDFGPATESAVMGFQKQKRIAANGEVDKSTFERLTAPMRNAIAPMSANGKTLGSLVIACAKQHLIQHPVEVGGQNRGPWVRLYMKGMEGPEYPWCAGFVCYVLLQACDALRQDSPVTSSFSCDTIAYSAKENNIFLKEPAAGARDQIGAGSIFLHRGGFNDWTHTGFVVKAGDDTFQSIEGNTNDDGCCEGYEVCARMRGYKNIDFILI